MADQDNTSKRGFASMDEERRREIARKGGKASHGNDNKGNDSGDDSNSSDNNS